METFLEMVEGVKFATGVSELKMAIESFERLLSTPLPRHIFQLHVSYERLTDRHT